MHYLFPVVNLVVSCLLGVLYEVKTERLLCTPRPSLCLWTGVSSVIVCRIFVIFCIDGMCVETWVCWKAPVDSRTLLKDVGEILLVFATFWKTRAEDVCKYALNDWVLWISSQWEPTFIKGHKLISVLLSTWSRLRVAVGLLTGYTKLRAHLYKLGYTEGQECRLCGYEKEDSVHIVCDCPVLAWNRCRILGYMFLKPEDLENVRVSSLLSLVANTGLGLVS
jgi:hypothetical protein